MLHHWEGPEVGIPASYRFICPSWQGWATLASPGTAREGLMSEDTGPAPCTLHMARSPGEKEERGPLRLLRSGSFHEEGMWGVGKQCSQRSASLGPVSSHVQQDGLVMVLPRF